MNPVKRSPRKTRKDTKGAGGKSVWAQPSVESALFRHPSSFRAFSCLSWTSIPILFLSLCLCGLARAEQASVFIAIGAAGQDEYADSFAKWAGQWQKASAAGNARATTIGLAVDEKDCLSRLRAALEAEPKESADELWLVLLGHGTAEAAGGKFNLRGDDLDATELAALLKPFRRPIVIVCGFSASGAFLKPLTAPDRVVLTATKSGSENNFARFGGYLAESIASPAADLDKDGQTSVLEAWLAASQRTGDFYKDEGRIATEHSLLDDNGDGLGTPADWFRGVRAVKKPSGKGEADGLRAHQIHLVRSTGERELSPEMRRQRDALEVELAKLREGKATMPEDAYYKALETVLIRIAELYRVRR